MTKKILIIKKFNAQTQSFVVLTYSCEQYSIDNGFLSFFDSKTNQKLSYPAEAIVEIKEVI